MSENRVCKNLEEIIIDDTIYPRNDIDPETAARYREALEAGNTLPPLVVMPDGRLLDGRHRYEAYKQAGVEEVEVVVEEPEDPDARAVELNLRHGRPLTKEELRQAARRWYGKKPVTEIAKTLGVTRQTVQNWVAALAAERVEGRKEIREKALELRAEGMTQEEVAKKLGVTQQVVSKWEYNSVKNLTPLYKKNSNNQPMEDGSVDTGTSERYEDGQESDEDNQENEYPDPDTAQELALLKAIVGCRIDTHYGTGGIVTEVSGPYGDGFYTIIYKHPRDGKKCWINSITVKENAILCEGVPLKITSPGENKQVPDIEAGRQAAEAESKTVSDKPESKWDRCKTCPCYQVDSCFECRLKSIPWSICYELYMKPNRCTKEDCEQARSARRENEKGKLEQRHEPDTAENKKETAPVLTEEDREEEKETGPQTGRQAAEAFRKKHLPYSDMVKEFYQQLKKTSELAEQLVNRKEDLIEAIAGMEADGMSITVLANAVIQACDIYFPRLSEARDVLEEVIKREVKGVVVKDRFVVVTGGKKNEG